MFSLKQGIVLYFAITPLSGLPLTLFFKFLFSISSRHWEINQRLLSMLDLSITTVSTLVKMLGETRSALTLCCFCPPVRTSVRLLSPTVKKYNLSKGTECRVNDHKLVLCFFLYIWFSSRWLSDSAICGCERPAQNVCIPEEPEYPPIQWKVSVWPAPPPPHTHTDLTFLKYKAYLFLPPIYYYQCKRN